MAAAQAEPPNPEEAGSAADAESPPPSPPPWPPPLPCNSQAGSAADWETGSAAAAGAGSAVSTAASRRLAQRCRDYQAFGLSGAELLPQSLPMADESKREFTPREFAFLYPEGLVAHNNAFHADPCRLSVAALEALQKRFAEKTIEEPSCTFVRGSKVNPGSPMGQPWVPDFWGATVGSRTKIVNRGSPRPAFSFACAGQPDQIVNL